MSHLEAEAREVLLRRRRSIADVMPAALGDPAARWTDYEAAPEPRSELVRRELAEIDAALERISEGRYGTCLNCGGPMGLQRLRAIPEARYCLACSGHARAADCRGRAPTRRWPAARAPAKDRAPVAPDPRIPAGEPVLAYVLGDALYLNLTSACTLACTFCPKIRDGDWVVGGFDLRLARPPELEEVWSAARRAGLDGRSEVVFTGLGEPTRRLDVLLELVRRLKAAGVARVRLDTDGLGSLREGKDVAALLAEAGLDAVSVSLNAADAETYARHCPSRYGEGAYAAVKDFIRSCVGRIPDVAASAVALPGLGEGECRAAAEALGARFRWRPYDRLGRIEGEVRQGDVA